MNVVVNKKDLVGVILESLADDKVDSPEFERISFDEDPIVPVEMMATQMAEEMPSVGDSEYVPASIEELGRAAYIISLEVPVTQIEYFYRKLHKLLDAALDREQEQDIKVESVRSVISKLLSEESETLPPEAEAGDVENLSSYVSATDKDKYILGYNAGLDDDAGLSVDIPDSPSADFMLGYEEGLSKGTIDQEPAESIVEDIVDDIIKKNLHITVLRDPESGSVNRVPVVIINPKTGDFQLSEKEMTVLASESVTDEIIEKALESSITSSKYDKLKSRFKTEEAAYMMLHTNLANILGKNPGKGNVVNPEDAAVIYANQIADALGKYGQHVHDALAELSKNLENQTEEIAVEIGKKAKRKSSDSDNIPVDDVLNLSVNPILLRKALLDVAVQRIEPPKRGRKKSQYEEISLSPEEKKSIRDTLKREVLDKIMKSGDNRDMLYLDQQMISTLQKLVAEETGQNVGTVRNVFYDTMLDLGLPAETMRKIAGVEKMPRGREAIPLHIDPLRLQAETEVVEKIYEIFRKSLFKYLDEFEKSEDSTDRELGESYKNLFLGKGGYYSEGLDGYLNLQSQTGGPYMSTKEDIDISSPEWKTRRKAYDLVQEFIDQIARDYVGKDSDAYTSAKGGGIRAIMNDMRDDEMFDTLAARGDFDELIDDKLSEFDKIYTDKGEGISVEQMDILRPMIDIVFEKGPKRTSQYIKRINKELG